MLRIVIGALLALVIFAGTGLAQTQMVNGTIKTVDVAKDVLIIKQKVKNDTVDRELSIRDTTKFIITTGKDKKELAGRDGLQALEGKDGASVAVQCDKDVNVLKVTVTIKK